MRKSLFLALSVSSLLGGCTLVSDVRGPDGNPAFSLNCGADRGSCYEKAGELCPSGYTVSDASQGMIASGGFAVPKNEMLISCK